MEPTYVVVAGGAGALGAKLCARLLSQSTKHVFCVDNLSQGKEERLAPLLENPRFTFLRADVCEPFLVPGRIERLYHLCDQAKDTLLALKTRGEGTFRILERAARDHARVLVVPAVTSSLLEVPPGAPHAEALALAFSRERREDVRVVRLASLFGPELAFDEGIVSSFIRSALERRPIPVEGDGSALLPLLYLEDAVDGLLAAMENEALRGEVLFLENRRRVTQRELARLIARTCGTRVRIAFDPLGLEGKSPPPPPEQEDAHPAFSWTPKVSLEEAISATVEALRPFVSPLPRRRRRRAPAPAPVTMETLFRRL